MQRLQDEAIIQQLRKKVQEIEKNQREVKHELEVMKIVNRQKETEL